jgi:hypothetical protein
MSIEPGPVGHETCEERSMKKARSVGEVDPEIDAERGRALREVVERLLVLLGEDPQWTASATRPSASGTRWSISPQATFKT